MWTLSGGVLIGLAVGAACLWIVGRTNDPLVEITLTTIAAYGSFLIAEHYHASGIISALAAGLMIGSVGWSGALSEEGPRAGRMGHWEYFAFVADADIVFILIGMNVASMTIDFPGAMAAGLAVLLVLAGRAVSIYSLAAAFMRSRWRLPATYQHTLFWGGLRGALAPLRTRARRALDRTRTRRDHHHRVHRGRIEILVQGLTMPWLIKRPGLSQSGAEGAVADASERS